MLKDFKACPPFVTDIDLSVDDQYLYVSCWGTGDFHQYDVSDPFKPKLTGKLRIGGMDHALRIRRPMGRSMVALRWSRSVAMDAHLIHQFSLQRSR